MKKLLLSIFTLATILCLTPVFSQPAYAACNADNTPVGQVEGGIDETGGNCSGDGVKNFLSTVVKILGIVAGAAAIIMIIISGFKYITSGGDTNKVASAKNTLIYAMVGVAVAVLAQLLVNFAFTTASNASSNNPCGKGYHVAVDPKYKGSCIKN